MLVTECLAQNSRESVYSFTNIRHRLAKKCVGARMRNFYQVGLIAIAVSMAVIPVNAQNLRNSSGPSELPPSSFGGAQFVDSEGCIYVRAGSGGNVNWVPRVTRDRKVMCGFPPTFAKRSAAKKPVAMASPKPVAKVAKVLATRGVVPKTRSVAVAIVPAALKIPKGYRLAWDDDRLNANRAKGTATGEAQMAAIWTTTVPRQLIANQKETTSIFGTKKKRKKNVVAVATTAPSGPAPMAAPKVVISSKTQPTSTFGRYVQVGTFGVKANAKATISKLQGLGLPVSRRSISKNGNELTIVFAGPFESSTDVPGALAKVRRNGFSDAFLVK